VPERVEPGESDREDQDDGQVITLIKVRTRIAREDRKSERVHEESVFRFGQKLYIIKIKKKVQKYIKTLTLTHAHLHAHIHTYIIIVDV
jgi:hypothetical protein